MKISAVLFPLLEIEKLTVIFDLDETLVSVKQNTQGANFELPVKVKDKIVKVIFLLFSWEYSSGHILRNY